MKKVYFLLFMAAMTALSGFATETKLTWTFKGNETTSKGSTAQAVNTILKADENAANGAWRAEATASVATSGTTSLGSTKIAFNGTISYEGTTIPENAKIKQITFTILPKTTYTVTAMVNGAAFGTASLTPTGKNTYTIDGEAVGNDIVLTFATNNSRGVTMYELSVTYEVDDTPATSVKLEAHELNNAAAVDQWSDFTAAADKTFTTANTVSQVRLTFTPATAGKTSTVTVGDTTADFTVTEENQGIFTYTFPEADESLQTIVTYESDYYGTASYTLRAANTSSVDGVAADAAKVVAVEGGIEISAAASVATVYDAAGCMVTRTAVNGKTTVALGRGLYIVALSGKAVKVAVR